MAKQSEAAQAQQPAPPAQAGNRPKPWVRAVVFFAALFTAWHLLASFLWIAPYSQNAREIVPGTLLSSYMLPFFGQSWSVFAPEPINGDYHFNVRARITDENGKITETGWVSATDVELSMIQYNLFPPRAGIQSSEVASNYKEAFENLEQIQRVIIGGDFVVDKWEIGLQAALENQAGRDTDNATDTADTAAAADGATADREINTAEITALLAEEHRATAYATQVAKAIWGDSVVAVQYRVSRQNIIPFAERHNPDAQRPEPTIVLPGWRGLLVEPAQNEEAFAEIFAGQFERITQ